MNIKYVPFIATILIAMSSEFNSANGQESVGANQKINKKPIDFSLGNFLVGMPFSGIIRKEFHPMATLGTEFSYREGSHFVIYQTVKLGGYYSRYNTSAFFINTEVGYRYVFKFGLLADINLGIGYSHLFRPNAVFDLSHGEYNQVRDWGKPSLLTNFSMSIGYLFSAHPSKPTIFIRYGNYIQLFYSKPDIPFLPQNSLQMGVRLMLNLKK